MSLREALEAGNIDRLKCEVKSSLRHINYTDWPDLYDLYTACVRTGDRSGCDLVCRQLPEPGKDRTVPLLSVRHFSFMELLRAECLNDHGFYNDADELVAMIKLIAARSGETEVERLVNAYRPRRTQ